MKKLLLLSCLLLAANIFESCGNDEPFSNNSFQEDFGNTDKENEDMKTDKLLLTIGENSFTVTLEDNASTQAWVKKLMEGPISVHMSDYGNMEKVGHLGFSLPRTDKSITTSPGDLILYQGNSFVIYYDTNSWNFTRLGKVDGVSTRTEMLDMLGGKGDIVVTLSLKQ